MTDTLDVTELSENQQLFASTVHNSLTRNEMRVLKSISEKILDSPYKAWYLNLTLADLRAIIETL